MSGPVMTDDRLLFPALLHIELSCNIYLFILLMSMNMLEEHMISNKWSFPMFSKSKVQLLQNIWEDSANLQKFSSDRTSIGILATLLL